MKVRLVQQVFIKGKPITFMAAYKDYESNFVARKGDKIADSAFDNEGHEVVEVVVDYEEEQCVIILHSVELDTDREEAVKEYIEKMVKFYGWKCDML